MTRLLSIPACALLWLWTAPAQAAPCDCDHVIEPDDTLVDATMLGVAAGDTVCVRGGPRPFLRLQQFKGEAGKEIEIRNCEGQVDIDNEDKGYGLTIDRSNFVHLTGTGDDAFEYGFRVRAAKVPNDQGNYSASSVAIGDLSSDIEVDHVEAYDSGFAGFIVKTDPRCDGSANLGNFVMYNSHLHHLYIHDTGGEGIYFGSTGYGGREYTCKVDGQDKKVILYPHEHHGAQIHDTRIENTGWDGAQIGVAPKDCAFYRNTIKNVGLAKEEFQQQGLQIGGASVCSVWGNVLMDGPTNAFFIKGSDDTAIYNNLVVNFAGNVVYMNSDNHPFDAHNYIAFNTFIQSGGAGIEVHGASYGAGFVASNVFVGIDGAAIAIGNDIDDMLDVGNVIAETPDDLGFVDPAARDFHLLETSSLRDAGMAQPELPISDDLDGAPRSDGAPDVGAYEFNLEGATTGDTTGSETGDESGSESGDADTGAPTTNATAPDTGDDDTGGSATGSVDDSGDAPTGGPGVTTGGIDPGGSSSGSGSDSDSGGETGDAGCGCNGAGPGAPLGLALLVLVRRRRRG